MDLEQTVKDLQAQNTQFQQLLLTLAKGQEELKTLLLREEKEDKEDNRSSKHGKKISWERQRNSCPVRIRRGRGRRRLF